MSGGLSKLLLLFSFSSVQIPPAMWELEDFTYIDTYNVETTTTTTKNTTKIPVNVVTVHQKQLNTDKTIYLNEPMTQQQ